MKHDELVEAAARWAEKTRYRVVLRDVRALAVSEQPDVIAWRSHGVSLLVECKASRSDFVRDKNKSWRRNAEEGMGYARYFAVPESLLPLNVAELGGWGLLLVRPRARANGLYPVEVLKKSGPFTKRNEAAERALLVSAVCRVTEGWGRRMFGARAPVAPDGDPPPSTARVIRELRQENLRLRARVGLNPYEAVPK